MLFVSGVFTPKGNLSSIDEFTIGSYQIHVFWWLIEFMFGVKIPKLAGWGGKKTGHKTMEREHVVITQMWDYCKQCEDIVIVSKTRKTFLDNISGQNLRRSEKTIAQAFSPFRLLEQLLPLRGWGVSSAFNVFPIFFMFINHLEPLPDCQNAFCTMHIVWALYCVFIVV